MSWFSKAVKKVNKAIKPVLKVERKIVSAQAGIVTLGLIKPKALGISNKSNQKLYRVSGNVGKVGLAVAGGVIAAPAVGAGLSSMGGLGAAVGGMFGKIKDAFSKIPIFGGNSKPDNADQTAAQVDGPGAAFGNLFTSMQNPWVLLIVGAGVILGIYFFRRK